MTGTATYPVQWKWALRRTFSAVRADEVRRGDLYANGATVTVSRRAKPEDVIYGLPSVDGVELPLAECWHIRTGKGFSVTTGRARPVVVGRAS